MHHTWRYGLDLHLSFFVGVAVDGRGLYSVLELWPINISISVSIAGIWLLSSSISDRVIGL